MKFIFALALFLPVGCTTLEPVPSLHLSYAVEAARKGELPKTRHMLESACKDGYEAGCDLLGQEATPAPPRLPVLQGVTAKTTTTVTVLENSDSAFKHFLWEEATLRLVSPAREKSTPVEGSASLLFTLVFEGLSPDKSYRLQILDSGDRLIDSRGLRTLDTSKKEVRFAIASCMDDSYSDEQKGMWSDLLSQKPDLLLMIGDNVYADKPRSPADRAILWRRYRETRETLEVFRSPVLVPVLAVWDDHDFGKNDGDRSFFAKPDAKEVFDAFFPQDTAEGFERGPGVASSFTGFNQQFVLMDDRFFRSSPKESVVLTQWGSEQENWLFSKLHSGDKPVWLVNGSQYFGGYHKFESYEGNFPQSFEAVLKRLAGVPRPIVFVSGDRHLAELMRIEPEILGYETYELTSSAIHAKTYKDAWKDTPNRRKLEGASGVLNYMLVESVAEPKAAAFSVTAFGPGKKVLFSRKLAVKAGRAKR